MSPAEDKAAAAVLADAQAAAAAAIAAVASTAAVAAKLQSAVDLARAALQDILECPVCLEDMVDPIQPVGCSHAFCTACLREWIQSRGRSCPTCRSPLPSASLSRSTRPVALGLAQGVQTARGFLDAE